MATQENSVQFSLKELSRLEDRRREEEILREKQRAEEEARKRAEQEANARRVEIEAQARRAAEIAAQEARLEAEAMLANERARIAEEERRAATPYQPAPQKPKSNWLLAATLGLSVSGLAISLGYMMTRPVAAPLLVIEKPISISVQENIPAPTVEAPPVVSEAPAVSAKPTKPKPPKPGADTKPKPPKRCDARDPLCGLEGNGD